MDNMELLQAINKRFEMMDEKIDKRFDEIDKRFEAMDKRFETIETRLDTMDKRIACLEKKVSNIYDEIVTINRHIADISHTISMEIRPRINMLTENYLPAVQKFSTTAARIDEMEQDIRGLKNIVAENTADYVRNRKKEKKSNE